MIDAPSLAASIGGSVVGVTGVIATVLGGRGQRRAALQLTETQHAHERAMARSERLFDRRAAVYQDGFRMLVITNETITFAASVAALRTLPADQKIPEWPSDDEWRNMRTRLVLYGASDVSDAFGRLGTLARTFRTALAHLRSLQKQAARSDQIAEALNDVETGASAFGAALNELGDVIRADITQL